MKTLFDQPIAHRNDPQTSYDAGQKMIDSGKLQEQEKEVLKQIKRLYSHPAAWFTAKSLARMSGLNYYKVQRRLSGLERKGHIINTGTKNEGCKVMVLKGGKNDT